MSFDELPKEERPPRNIWLDPKAMRKWWKKVERERDAKYNPDKRIDGDSERNAAVDDLIG